MKTMKLITNKGLLKSLAVVAATLLVSPWAGQAQETKADRPEEQKLVVHVSDIKGMGNIDAEWVREDLLRTAFYEAARKYDWVGDYEFKYNVGTPKNAKMRLEFTVIDWDRSASNFFEFVASARYFDADGNVISLGTFQGIRSGLDIFNRFDVSERFVDVAEDAFSQALRKLMKTTS